MAVFGFCFKVLKSNYTGNYDAHKVENGKQNLQLDYIYSKI